MGNGQPVRNGPKGQNGLVIGYAVFCLCRRLLHGRRVQDVAEDHRLTAKEFEVGIHEFAKRVGLPVVAEAQLFHRFRPAGAKDGDAGFRRLGGRVDGGRANHKGNPRVGHHRRAHRRRLFIDMYA